MESVTGRLDDFTRRVAAFIQHSGMNTVGIPMQQVIDVFFKSQLQPQDKVNCTGRIKYRLRSMNQASGACNVCNGFTGQLFAQSRHPEIVWKEKAFFSSINPGYFVVVGHEPCLRSLRMQHESDIESVFLDDTGAEITVYKALPFTGVDDE